ncbi:replication-associated recombination protein A, partial [Thermophilibacter provencensis]
MDTLFTRVETARKNDNAPLAARMRPTTLDGYVGQAQAVGPGSWLRRAIEHDTLSSVILYGPAGTGKTTLARIIANSTHAEFVEVSAITGTVKDLRREIEAAESRLLTLGRRTILFVDEIHRFNRSQQDALLHAVEDRIVVLVGATTENPYFEVNSALISRSRVVELTALDDASVRELVRRAVAAPEGLAARFELSPEAEDEIVTLAGGDGRAALTSLELASQMVDAPADGEGGPAPLVITREHVVEANPRRGLPYDKSGDMHYDVISAFIKSMRGSDPDAVLYWLARMLDAGEDPKFIARRIMICASEDIGNADPQALLVAHAAFRATEVIGMPECRINLAQ